MPKDVWLYRPSSFCKSNLHNHHVLLASAPDRCRLVRPVFRTNSPREGRHPWPRVLASSPGSMPSGSAGVLDKQPPGGTSPVAAGTRFQPRIDAVWFGRCSGQTAPGRDVTRGRGYSLPAPDRCRLARPVFWTNSPREGRHPWPLVIKRWFSLPSSPPVITLFLRVMIARGPLYVPATSAVFCTNTSNGCSSSFRIDLGLVCIGYFCGPIISVSMETILYLNNIDTAKFNNSTVRSHFRSRTRLKRILKSDVTWGNFFPSYQS